MSLATATHPYRRSMIGMLCLLFGITTTATHSLSAGERPPNVILIMADDIGLECFGCYGSEQYKTPNIDGLAAKGMRFTHCYSQPLCTPSRVKLMTGLSNARNYSAFSVLNRDQKTFGHYFQEAGYKTAVAGKWQLYGAEHYGQRFRAKGTMPNEAGFDAACLWQVDKLGQRFHGPLMWIDGKNRQFDKRHYGPQVATDYLIDFIGKHKDEPFFAYYPMILTHDPFVPTPDSDDAKSKDRQKNFEDMVQYMDKVVGEIVAATERHHIADNTLVLFVGDNGTHRSLSSSLGKRTIRGGKGKTLDDGIRVPFIAYWPGRIGEGTICEDLVDFSDFLPTILDAAQQEPPSPTDGVSFWQQLTGKPGSPRSWLYCYYCPRPEKTVPVRFARTKNYKLYGDGQFFKVDSDPLEESPLEDSDLTAEARANKKLLLDALQEMPSKGQQLLDFGTDPITN